MTSGRIPRTYQAARAAFRASADRHGWARTEHQISALGPDGEPLDIDVATSPGDSPASVLVVLSGVHGVEGFIGSALQCDAIERMSGRLPRGLRVVLVHAVNPWGMAWHRRQNEHNVDLNRNWGRTGAAPFDNPDYAVVHDALEAAQHGMHDVDGALAAVTALVTEYGLPWVEHAITAGQSSHPDGLHYAGERTEESNRVLAAVLPPLLRGATSVMVLDLHTGVGRPGTITRLTDEKPGRVSWGVARLAPGAYSRAVTVEVGTTGDLQQLRASLAERWAWRHADRTTDEGATAVAAYLACFTPDDESWERTAMELGRAEIDDAALAAFRPTSAWMSGRHADGGVDTVPLPSGPGGLSMCGKHAIAPDVHGAMVRCGATTVVCLVERHEIVGHWPHYVEWLEEHQGAEAVWFPIHDLNAPALDRALPFLDELHTRLARGEHLLLHCAAGIGRTGTVAACLLVGMGLGVEDALEAVRAARPGAGPEAGTQRELVEAVAARRRAVS